MPATQRGREPREVAGTVTDGVQAYDGRTVRGPRHTGAPTGRVEDAVMLFTLERTLDAVAEGETTALGLDEEAVIAHLRILVQAALARA